MDRPTFTVTALSTAMIVAADLFQFHATNANVDPDADVLMTMKTAMAGSAAVAMGANARKKGKAMAKPDSSGSPGGCNQSLST